MRLQLPTLLLFAACSSSPSIPKQTKDTPNAPVSKPVEKPAIAAPTPDTKPATVISSQPTSAPVETTVVFVVDNQMAIPLGCFDASTKMILAAEGSDASCAKLIAAAAPVKLSNDTTSKLKEKSEWVCEPAEFKQVAFPLDPQLPTGSVTELAVSPPSAPILFFPRVDETKFSANAEESTLLTEAIKKSEPSAKKVPNIHQLVKLDLDYDGKVDTIFSTTVAGESEAGAGLTSIEGRFTFGGMFIRYGNKPEALVLLRREDFSMLEVRGAIDLNGDGRMELIVSDTQWEGYGMVLYEVGVDGALKPLGDWGCGA
jgi:hypothetical protein